MSAPENNGTETPPPLNSKAIQLLNRLLPVCQRKAHPNDFIICPVQTFSEEDLRLCIGRRCAAFRQSTHPDWGYCKIIDSGGKA